MRQEVEGKVNKTKEKDKKVKKVTQHLEFIKFGRYTDR